VVSTTHEGAIRPAVYAIPFDRVWDAAKAALEGEGAQVERADDTAGQLQAYGEGGFPRQRWSVEVRVALDRDAQTRVDLTVKLLEGLDLGRTSRRARRLMAAIDRGAGADAGSRLAPRSGAAGAVVLAALVAAGVAACGPEAPAPVETEAAPEAAPAPERSTPLRSYERAFAFRAADVDSTLAVVWLFEHDDLGSAVERRSRGLLLRGGIWDAFHEEVTEDPPTESPWRLLPSGPLRLVVGTGSRVDRVIYQEGERLLELELRGGGASWTGRRGGNFAVEEATVVLGDRAVRGQAVDVSRARLPDEAPTGDWAFLTSGDSIAILLQAPMRSRDANAWQGWVLRGQEEMLLPELTLAWSDTRAFVEARRDVPIAWSLTSPEGELSGSFERRTADLRAVEAPGALLPVDGVFDVVGEITLGGVVRPVEGIVRHRQGAGG